MDGKVSILLAAVEPSADEIAAQVYRELKNLLAGQAKFVGCGGERMRSEGFHSAFSVAPFSVMGATDVLRVAPLAVKRAHQLTDLVAANDVNVAIFVDGWAFSRLAARQIRKRSPNTRIYKLAAPQIWASRASRIKFVKNNFDGVLALLPFEPDLFRRDGVRSEFIGNPNFQSAWNSRGTGEAFRKRHNLVDREILAVFLGSRASELRNLARTFRETAISVCERRPNLQLITVPASNIADDVKIEVASWPGKPIIVPPEEKYDAFAAADVALAASGTISTELAINQTPTIIAYKVDPLTALWARRVVKTPFASIINVLADEFIIPEFIQEKCQADLIADKVLAFLADESLRAKQVTRMQHELGKLEIDGPPAAARAAKTIVDWAKEDNAI
ncbi:MAG: lipid-A-disaccharide synthase [Parvularculaceae bacterium]|nr:lipid-A-disaccharide synthase [Parvularculaceae bacterium]